MLNVKLVANRLKHQRKRAEYTQNELVELIKRAGIEFAQSTYSRMESGEWFPSAEVPGESRSIVLFEAACKQIEAYAELHRLIKARAFDVLAFLDISRLGRTVSLCQSVISLCAEAGIICYETGDPPTSLEFAAFGYERMLISAIKAVGSQQQIIKLQSHHEAGMIDRIKRGKFATAIPWGWQVRYAEDGTRIIEANEAVASVLNIIFEELYLTRGLGTPAISEWLNAQGYRAPAGGRWDRAKMRAVFDKIWRYAGYAEVNVNSARRTYTKARGEFPSLITDAIAERVIAERKRRIGARRSVGSIYRFSGVVWCAECGQRMFMATAIRSVSISKKPGDLYKYLRCSGEHERRYITEQAVEDALHDAIVYLHSVENREQLYVEPRAKADTLREKLEQCDLQEQQITNSLQRADDAFADGVMDAERYRRQVARLNEQGGEVRARRLSLLAEIDNEAHASQRVERLSDIAEIGLIMLLHEDVKMSNAWLLPRFKVYVRNNAVETVEYL